MKDEQINAKEENKKEGKDRRDFLKKAGIGGAALVAGSVLNSKPAKAQEVTAGKKNGGGRSGKFETKYFSQHKKPLADASNKFTIDLRDFQLDDEGLAAVRNAMVAAAIAQVKQSGKPTAQNFDGSFATFSTFSTFSSFGSFASFASGATTPQ